MPIRIPAWDAMPPIKDGVITEPRLEIVTNTPIANGYSLNTFPALATVVPYMPERAKPKPTVPISIEIKSALISSTDRNTKIPPQSARIMRGGATRPDRAPQMKRPANMTTQSIDVSSCAESAAPALESV